MSEKKHILIVEDDDAIATGLALNLKIAGYAPLIATDGDEALSLVADQRPDLILLDINLPRKNGISVLAELRGSGDPTPIIMLSAREDEYDKVATLRLGADDYVIKPFALAELLARVDAVLRRYGAGAGAGHAAPASSQARSFGQIAIDLGTRTVTRAGEPVRLTHLEFELLSFLIENPSRVFSRDQLLRQVWGQRSGSPRTVDNFVGQLRSKLEVDAEHPQHFITVRGSGYRFDR